MNAYINTYNIIVCTSDHIYTRSDTQVRSGLTGSELQLPLMQIQRIFRGNAICFRGFRGGGRGDGSGSSWVRALLQVIRGIRIRMTREQCQPYIRLHTYIHTVVNTYIHTYMQPYVLTCFNAPTSFPPSPHMKT